MTPAASTGSRLNVFAVGGEYVFKHFFDDGDLFDQFSTYYDREEYRFEVPADDLDSVLDALRANGFDPSLVEETEPYTVVKAEYTPYAEILKRSVAFWSRQEHNFFLMRDMAAVERALTEGATRLADTEFVSGL